ncbi:MAG TPA: GTPase [Acidimicrobiales bacterium]|nr:GTPase [Acidimicrobiales bacterium]
MPMPHRTFQQVIKRRLVGKEGSARTKELRAILAELPDYRNGPYADLRRWVTAQIGETERRRGATHRDSIAVRRQGAAQIALVGPPNAGKSSLLQALSDVQIRTGDYAFTTTRPVAAATRAGGVLVQLIEIPGLIDGAAEGRGGGRALLSVLRTADAMVLCHDLSGPASRLDALRAELEASDIDLPCLVAATKADDAASGAVDALRRHVAPLAVVEVSVLDDISLDALRDAIWDLTGLVRVYLRRNGVADPDPIALPPPVTVAGVAHTIHHEIGSACRGARLWGGSARFAGQRVGPGHRLADGDTVEIVT